MGFVLSKDLKRHARTHTGIRPYVCPVPVCSRAFSRPDNMRRHIRSKHPDPNSTSLNCSAKKDNAVENFSREASIQASIEPLEIRSPCAVSSMVPAGSSSPSIAVATVDTDLEVHSPGTLDDVSESQANHREHQSSTGTPLMESVLERIIELSLKLQALEEEHRALLSIDPELLGPGDSSSSCPFEEEEALSDQDAPPPTDQPGVQGTERNGEASSLLTSFSSNGSGFSSGGSGSKRNRSDDNEEWYPDDESSKRSKGVSTAAVKSSNKKPLFQCPERGCPATFYYLGKLM